MNQIQHQDTIFLNPDLALATARQANRVQITSASTGLQVCYYLSQEPLPERLPNLIHVNPSSLVQFYATTRLRMPTRIEMAGFYPETMRQRLSQDLLNCMQAAREKRLALTEGTIRAIHAGDIPPPERPGRLRVMGWGSRTTMVMQHATRGVIEAFARLGHDAKFVIEDSDIEALASYHITGVIRDFQPHLVINVNYLNNISLHPKTANVVWWMDMMPELTDPAEKLRWRENDLVYSLHKDAFCKALVAKGLPPDRQRNQNFCIDDSIYHPEGGPPREARTIVFVGTSYRSNPHFIPANPIHARFLDLLNERIQAGEVITVPEMEEFRIQHGITTMHLAGIIWNIAIRDEPVRWICSLAQQGWKVEIYGHGWESDPVVAPFHRGALKPGRELAELYRRASHALSLTPNILNHQRLPEIACCGCIPVVYDCRRASPLPHWDDHQVVYFTDKASLMAGVQREFQVDSELFRREFSYDRFAERIIADLRSRGLLREELDAAPPELAPVACGSV